ncbi:MAG TPA: tyrosinase family protein [Bryobacteraceae bacterium]|jgi:hypothetical protein
MGATRRQWLNQFGSGAAAVLCLPQASRAELQTAAIPRKPVSRLDGRGQGLLRQVYAAWNTLDAADPWSRESHRIMHLNQCSEHSASGVDVHNTWDFLPWHRCFVHFHERILIAVAKAKSVSGAENFRLPYWDWDAAPKIPEVYLTQGSPLYMAREQDPIIDYYTTPGMLGAMLSPTQFQGSTGFGGDAQSRGVASSAPPHSKIHKIVSDVMNDPDTAASDPLFYIHHANVDRLWEIWARHQGQKASDYPAELLAKTYTFPGGQSRAAFTYRVQDILDTSSLGYTYDSYECGVQFDSETTALEVKQTDGGFTGLNMPPAGVASQHSASSRINAAQPTGRAVVYLTVSGIHLPYKPNGYFLFLKSKDPGIAPLELGNVSPFQSRHAKELVLSATVPIDPTQLSRFAAGFQVVYKESESVNAADAGIVPSGNLSLLARTVAGPQ